MLPTANFEPVRCTLLSVRAFDFDNNLCAFTVNEEKGAAAAAEAAAPTPGPGARYETPFDATFGGRFYDVELRRQHVARAKDKFAWKMLQRASSTSRSQVKAFKSLSNSSVGLQGQV